MSYFNLKLNSNNVHSVGFWWKNLKVVIIWLAFVAISFATLVEKFDMTTIIIFVRVVRSEKEVCDSLSTNIYIYIIFNL